MDDRRREGGFSVVGGPTTLIDIAGWRIVIDPVFDPPGAVQFLTKTAGPAVAAASLGHIDVVLISHDEHPDNLDTEGRRVALGAPMLITHPRAAHRLGPRAWGLEPWESLELPASQTTNPLTVQAVPAVHGPLDGQRDSTGHVNAEVTGFVLSAANVPTVYLSGDNASIGVVKEIAQRVGNIDIAVLFAGAARVPTKSGGRPLTLTGQRAAAAAELLAAEVVIPAHVDSWSHLSEGLDDFVTAFDEAGIAAVLATAPHGHWIVPRKPDGGWGR
ncbi:MBL fold metallo-hydrolase [Mycolicibacterium hodleri]|uniref:MBL fold metallo-hydrolase n=1 Tax=Mycolicibacterium hodleri TaxID=49897 RepID=A0A502DT53_9MYCO|nr:MBL fold metallo-hydrolase [Mycolicibacterium hodleri]